MRRRMEHGSEPCRKHIPRGVLAVGWIHGPLPRDPGCFLYGLLPCDAHATPRRVMTRAFTSDTQALPRSTLTRATHHDVRLQKGHLMSSPQSSNTVFAAFSLDSAE